MRANENAAASELTGASFHRNAFRRMRMCSVGGAAASKVINMELRFMETNTYTRQTTPRAAGCLNDRVTDMCSRITASQ